MRIVYTLMLGTMLSSCTQAYWQTSPAQQAEQEMNAALQEQDEKYQHGLASAALAFVTLGVAGDNDYKKIQEAQKEEEALLAAEVEEKTNLDLQEPQEIEEETEADGLIIEEKPGLISRMVNRLWEEGEEVEDESPLEKKLNSLVIGETTFEQVREELGAPVYMFKSPEFGTEARFMLQESVPLIRRFSDAEETFAFMTFNKKGVLTSVEVE